MKNAVTARYFPLSASTSGSTSTKTSISIDLLLVKVIRPDTVITQPAEVTKCGLLFLYELYVSDSMMWLLKPSADIEPSHENSFTDDDEFRNPEEFSVSYSSMFSNRSVRSEVETTCPLALI